MHSPVGADNQAQLLAGVLDSSLDGIMAFRALRDAEDRIVDFVWEVVNKAALTMVGHTAEELVGQRLLEVMPGNKTDGLFDAYINVVETGQPLVTEHHYTHEGLDTWFRTSAARCGDGFTVTFANISASKAAEQALTETTHLLNEAQALAKIGSWQWTLADNQILWSDQTKQMFGVPLDQPAPDFETHQKQIHPDDREHWYEVVKQAMADRQPYVMKFRSVTPDGRVRVIEGRGRCQTNDADEIIQMHGTVQDITEQEASREKLKTANERFELMVYGNASGVWDWDCKTDALYWSPRFKELIGYADNEIDPVYDDFVSHLHPEDREPTIAKLQAHIAGQGPYDVEYRLRHRDGHYIWCHASGQAQWDPQGKPIRMAGSITDISERRLVLLELEAARDLAQQASDAKSAFVANMSHEIRTPMNAILGYADLLLDGDQSEADKRNHAQTIRRNGKHLLSIINDVLDISKIEAGKMSIETVACTTQELFSDVINLMKPKAADKGIDLRFEANHTLPKRIKTDPTRIRQVLLNLVGNAIKFTDTGSITLRINQQPAHDDLVELSCEVIDTGIGIDAQQLEHLFKPFRQADTSTTRRFGGTGLGLAISKNLCVMLGGGLTCKSSPDEGSVFTARFLVKAVQSERPITMESEPIFPIGEKPLAGKRILVVEDGADNQRLI